MATYKVKKGDNLASVAKQYKTTAARLKEINRVASLSTGQVIRVPNTVQPVQPTPPNLNTGVIQYSQPAGPFVPIQQSLIPPPVTPGLSPNNTAWPPRPVVPPPAQTLTQAQRMAMFAGRSTGATYVNPTATASQGLTPSQAQTIPGTQAAQPVQPAQPQNTQPTFPGFWGGGKNGGFYKTLREAKFATKRLRQQQEEGDQIYQPAIQAVQPNAGGNNVNTGINWRVG